jgi:hypothetical protein
MLSQVLFWTRPSIFASACTIVGIKSVPIFVWCNGIDVACGLICIIERNLDLWTHAEDDVEATAISGTTMWGKKFIRDEKGLG